MTENNVLSTVIHEPSMTAGEVDMLLFAPPSTMTLAGLIKHLALVEDSKTAEFVTGEPMGAPWAGVEGMSVWEWA